MELWQTYHPFIPQFLQDFSEMDCIQRLKNVGMNCGCEYTQFPVFRNIRPYSRFDHSVGVALIVWHFTGSIAAAVAGLLHDIATPAFAHTVDFLHGDHIYQETTEAKTVQVITNCASLQRLVEKYALSLDEVKDYRKYPIADNASPKLSADRLEYTLCNAVNYGLLSAERAALIYDDLTVGVNENGEPEIVFCSHDLASEFSHIALACSKIYVSDEDRYAMERLAFLLRDAIDRGIMSESDLDSDEVHVIEKINHSEMKNDWIRFCNYRRVYRLESDASRMDALRVFAKKRYIDPYIRGQGRVSSIDGNYHDKLINFLDSSYDYWIAAE